MEVTKFGILTTQTVVENWIQFKEEMNEQIDDTL